MNSSSPILTRFFRIASVLLLAVLLSGCGGGGGGGSAGSNGSGTNSPGGATGGNQPPTPETTAAIRLEMVLERAVPTAVGQIRCTGFGSNGEVRYGPVLRSKSPVLEYSNVPLDVTQIQIELLAQSQVVGVGRVQVRLVAGQTFSIIDPNFEDVDASLTSLSLEPSSLRLAAGTFGRFKVVGRYSDGTVLDLSNSVGWQFPNAALDMDESGNVEGLTPGNHEIQAHFAGFTARGTVTVTDAVLTQIRLEPPAVTLPIGLSQPLTVTAIYSDRSQQDITAEAQIQFSPTGLASWQSGSVKALSAGSGTVQASYQGQATQASLSITEAVLTRIEIGPVSPTTPKGLATQLSATGHLSDGSTRNLTNEVTWTSDTPSIGTVATGGMATGHALGEVIIRAGIDAVSGSTTLTVTEATLQRVTLTPNTFLPLGLTQQLTLLAHYSDGTTVDVTTQGTYSSDNTDSVSVTALDPRGVAKAHRVGIATITGAYGGKQQTVEVSAIPAILRSLTVSPQDYSIPKGLTHQFHAEGTYSDESTRNLTDQVQWIVDSPDYAQIDSAGVVTALSQGEAIVEASLDGVIASANLLVSEPALTRLEIRPTDGTVPLGQSQTFSVYANFSDGTIHSTPADSWSSSDPEIASIDSGGLLTAHLIGKVTITVNALGANASSEIEVIRIGDGEGFFSTPTFGTHVSELQVGDLNGDNFPDAVGGYTNNSFVQIRLNDGTGRLTTEANIEMGGTRRVGRVRIGDLDGDLDLDVVVSETSSRQIRIYLNNGSAGFSQTGAFSITPDYPAEIELIDLNGDTALDILFQYTHNGSETLIGYVLNNGSAVFGPRQAFTLPMAQAHLSQILDFDEINGNDILWRVGTTYYLSLNNGDGTFAAPFILLNNVPYYSLCFGDWNADGAKDLAYTLSIGAGENDVHTLLNDGANNFAPVGQYTVGDIPSLFEPADINGDGNLDLIGTLSNTNESYYLLGLGDGSFEPAVPLLGEVRAMKAVDLDGDSDLDLLGTSELGFLAHFNRAGFERASFKVAGDNHSPLAKGDFNGDGNLDLAIVGPGAVYTYDILLLLNDGNGYFPEEVAVNPGNSVGAVDVADFNGDGLLDLFSIKGNTPSNRGLNISLATGTGTTFSHSFIPTAEHHVYAMLRDFDGDGDIDIAGTQAANVVLYKNNGSGQFTLQPIQNEGIALRNPIAYDMDGDGDVDIIGLTSDLRVTILPNNGDGTFGTPVKHNTGVGNLQYLDVGDIDGDGDVDAVVTHGILPRTTVVMKNDGSGNLSPSDTFTQLIVVPPMLLDVDHDGDLDLITDSLKKNDGSGQFGLAELFQFASRLYMINGDFDNDGDPDLVLTQTYYVHTKGVYLYRNYPLPEND